MISKDQRGLENRFLSKIKKQGDCWLWTASRFHDGYGSFKLKGKVVRAHRVSYSLFKGPVPSTIMVCHTCDVKECVNPEHLFLGCQKQNMKDMKAKGRANRPVGASNGRATLTDNDVYEARNKYSKGESIVSLARTYGVGSSTMARLVHNVSWKHLL